MQEKKEKQAQSHGELFAVHDASGKTVGYFEVDEKANKELVGSTAETPWAAEHIRELEEQLNVTRFLFNQAAKELESEQVENHKLRCALSHIVDWCPEPSDYVKDEYIRLFRNAIATARELLRKTKVEEGK